MRVKDYGGVMSKQSKRSRWQSYIDDALLKTGQISAAAIHGLDGKRWATSPGFEVSYARHSLTCSVAADLTYKYVHTYSMLTSLGIAIK